MKRKTKKDIANSELELKEKKIEYKMPWQVKIEGKKLSQMIADHKDWMNGETTKQKRFTLIGRNHNIKIKNVEFFKADILANKTIQLSFAIWDDVKFINCKFSGGMFDNSTFVNCDFENCIIDNLVNFNNTTFKSCDFVNTKFSRPDSDHSTFTQCNFIECDFFHINFLDIGIDKCIFTINKFSMCSNMDGFKNNCNVIYSCLGNIPISLSCPSEGSFIGWKKVRVFNANYNEEIPYCVDYLVKLQIPASAKRTSALSNKCRCSKAKVLGIYNLDGTKTKMETVSSTYIKKSGDSSTVWYEVGKYAYPDSFDEDRWHECSNGIHFFINKEDAVNY